MPEQDPYLTPSMEMQTPESIGIAEQMSRVRQVGPEVGHATLDLIEASEQHEALESRGIVSPQAAMLELTSRSEAGVSLTKLENTVGDPNSVLNTIDTMEAPTDEKKAEVSARAIALLRTDGLNIISPPVPAGSVGKEAYDGTQRDRKMFTAGETGGSSRTESYFSQLFAGAVNPELVQRVAEGLQGKKILNLGGGNAKLTAELAAHGVQSAEVINVEPYPSDSALEGGGYDHIVQENPAEQNFFERSELPEQSVDEIWAVFSVPAYLGTDKEVNTVFDNVKRAIKPGGIIRMSHFGLAESASDVAGTSFAERTEALMGSLESAKDEGYLVEVVTSHNGTKTLIMTAPESAVA